MITAKWPIGYTLTYDERRQFMHDHGTVGRTYTGKIWQYITGSIGLDDFEWGVTLFAETPLMFKKIIAEMRYHLIHALPDIYSTIQHL